MRAFNLSLAAAATVLAATSNVYADQSTSVASNTSNLTESAAASGWYFSGEGGLSFLESAHNSGGGIDFNTSAANPGFDLGAALGRELGNGFRAEGELAYRRINLDRVTGVAGVASGPAGGAASALSVMGNGYYDFQTATPIKPYVGLGAGFARVNFDKATVNGAPLVDDGDVEFAYQAIGGVGYDVSPTGTVFTQYRHFATLDPTFTAASGQSFNSQFADSSVELGYRFRF